MAVNPEDKTRASKPLEPIVGDIVIHAPDKGMGKWWIREDLAARFREPVNEVLTRLRHHSISYPADTPRWTLDLMSRLTVSNDGPTVLIQADNREDIVAIAQWIAQRSDPRDRQNWSVRMAIEPGAARLQRPALEVPATFDSLLETRGRVSRNHVPIEAVRPGDRQVVAACFPGSGGLGPAPSDPNARFDIRDMGTIKAPIISLDSLADFPEVVSVIAATPVEAHRPLPSIRELLLLHNVVVPDASTLANLTHLEAFFSVQPPWNCKLELDAFPETLRRLAVRAWCMGENMFERLDPLGRLKNLEELRLFECYRYSLKAVGTLTKLRKVHIGGESRMTGWNALRHCVLLEDAFLGGLKANDLGAFRGWTKLRRLCISGRGLRSLAGIEAFAALEELQLIMVAIDDLTPLRGHQALNTFILWGTKGIRDLGPLAELPKLRSLEIEQAGIDDRGILHVRSLRPLARCESLQCLSLKGTIVDDADLAALADLPKLQRLNIIYDDGSLASAIGSLRRARPDIDIHYHTLKPLPGQKVGEVIVHPPDEGISTWWIRDDLTELLKASTNYGAEKKLCRALAAENPGLLTRLEFDSESSAVVAHAKSEDDIRALAELINRLAPSR